MQDAVIEVVAVYEESCTHNALSLETKKTGFVGRFLHPRLRLN